MQRIRTLDEYFSALPKETRVALEAFRKTIREAAPQAEETISYNIPAFKWNGVLVWYAAFKKHIGLYPKASAIAAFQKELAAYKTSKGAIQFPIGTRIPVGLVKKIVKFRLKENEHGRTSASIRTSCMPSDDGHILRNLRTHPMTASDFRRLALSLEGVEEYCHAGLPAFRVGGRKFASLASQAEGYGNLMLTLEQQAAFVEEAPEIFLPIPGGWGKMGHTHIRLAASEDVLMGAVRTAWKLRIDKDAKTSRKNPCGGAQRSKR